MFVFVFNWLTVGSWLLYLLLCDHLTTYAAILIIFNENHQSRDHSTHGGRISMGGP